MGHRQRLGCHQQHVDAVQRDRHQHLQPPKIDPVTRIGGNERGTGSLLSKRTCLAFQTKDFLLCRASGREWEPPTCVFSGPVAVNAAADGTMLT
jgi:hypothetical protein